MSNPFKKIISNVQLSKNSMFEDSIKNQVEIKTICCKSCGAPRPINTNLVKCNYCNEPFMSIDSKIKA